MSKNASRSRHSVHSMTDIDLLAPDLPAGLPDDIVLRPYDPDGDVALLHAWVTHPRSRFWDMQDATEADVDAAYRAIHESRHEQAWIGELDGEPIYLIETYDPGHHPLAEQFAVQEGDLGMHLLVAPPTGPMRSGLTSTAMRTALELCFALGAQRVVVEPDVRNAAIHAKNAEVGFVRVMDVDLPDKRAALSVCTRDAYRRATSPENLAWEAAEQLVVAKALGEFAHELLIEPEHLGDDAYVVRSERADWHFRARRYALDHWAVEPDSVRRHAGDGSRHRGSSSELVLDLADRLNLHGELLTTYLEELGATVAHRVRTSGPDRPGNDQLLTAPAHVIEAAMGEGHPCFVATNGRIGFSFDDMARYTPEAAPDVRPLWAAVPREYAHLAHTQDLDEKAVYDTVLGAEWHAELRRRMQEKGLTPDAHHLLPLHPWQCDERIRTTFAEDVARGRIVLLGEDPDVHRPAQSIRTWINVSSPERPYVKTALAIRNMGFVRGLSPTYMRATPSINDHIATLVRADETLQEVGFDILTEFASIGYTGDVFHRHGLEGPQTRMIAGLWRESPASRTAPDEQLMTMAALLHRDPHGLTRRPFVVDLIEASGLSARAWLRGYLTAYMTPIVHLLCEHRLAFIPHGENIILRMRDHAVVGVLLKDIGEEVGLMDDGTLGTRLDALPEQARRIHTPASSEDIALGLFTDVFDGFLRFLAPLLVEADLMGEDEFWAEVNDVLDRYEKAHPDAAASLPLRTPRFARSCLNRLQLRNPLEMVQLSDAVGSLIKAGELPNPVAHAGR